MAHERPGKKDASIKTSQLSAQWNRQTWAAHIDNKIGEQRCECSWAATLAVCVWTCAKNVGIDWNLFAVELNCRTNGLWFFSSTIMTVNGWWCALCVFFFALFGRAVENYRVSVAISLRMGTDWKWTLQIIWMGRGRDNNKHYPGNNNSIIITIAAPQWAWAPTLPARNAAAKQSQRGSVHRRA